MKGAVLVFPRPSTTLNANCALGRAVLEELRVLWEEKLQQSGVLAAAPPRSAHSPTSFLHQL